MQDELPIRKVNRRGRQERERKAHRHVISRNMGLPKWERQQSRKKRDRQLGILIKKARKQGLP